MNLASGKEDLSRKDGDIFHELKINGKVSSKEKYYGMQSQLSLNHIQTEN